MLALNGERPATELPVGEAQEDRYQQERCSSRKNQNSQALYAELIGSRSCRAFDITADGYAPVLLLCRKLIAVGIDPATPLDVYRGNILAMKITSIGIAAGFVVEDDRFGNPIIRQERPLGAGRASLMRLNRPAARGT